MKLNKIKALLFSTAFTVGVTSLPTQAGIPVIDGGNLTQNVVSAMESVTQTLTQIDQYAQQVEQYSTQLTQLQAQIENNALHSLAPVASIWDSAQSTMDKLVAAQDTLNYYQNKLGSLNSYLDKFQDVAYYRNSPCFTSVGCSDQEMKAMEDNMALANEAQKKANDALFENIDQQQDNLKADARTLEKLQRAAQGAEGQLQAIGYANQLASNQTNQLMQMRSLMVAQQNSFAAQRQAEIDIQAKQQAAHEMSTENRYEKTSDPVDWTKLLN